ncbi:MAG: translocation/assembly module TamB domain-containing protein [Vicinamibacterales bacterium]
MRAVLARARRWAIRVLEILALLAAVAFVAAIFLLTVDLGPLARQYAERYGSRYLERPLHVGKVGIRLATGDFVIENLLIEGLTPDARPFLSAKRIEVSLPWWTLVRRRQLLIESVRMTDWDMTIELFRDGHSSLPRIGRGQGGQRRFTTRVQYVHATRGQFTYLQHGTWTNVSRNLDVVVGWSEGYVGRATFSDGTVAIKDYVPMRSEMRCTFRIEGGKVLLDRIDLATDGAKSVIEGEVDFGNWPNQYYKVKSRLQAPRMREIFFARRTFTLEGEADFDGLFRLFKGGGYRLEGRFESPEIRLSGFSFPALAGRLTWTPDRFIVYDASAAFYGGHTAFTFGIAPMGSRESSWARLDTSYDSVDLAEFTDFLDTKGIRLSGRASGRNLLEWPLDRWSDHRGRGTVAVEPPAGVELFARTGPAVVEVRTDAEEAARQNPGPLPLDLHVPVGGHLTYSFGPEWVDLDRSWAATPTTYVEFEGRTAYGEESRLPFYTRSADWQESDRLLAGIITAFGSPTGVVPMGGHGDFRGVMLGTFRRPRIEGTFRGSQTRAWGVVWGQATGRVTVEGGYVDVSGVRVLRNGSEIRAEGRFSLSYPRKDDRDEIDARIWIEERPVADLRHAFGMDEYPLEGTLSGEFHVYGRYNRPFGFGKAKIAAGEAYGETFEEAAASLRFEGTGVRFDGIRISKGGGGITGAAHVGWDGRYSFNADGRRIPVESLELLRYEQAPLYGLIDFKGGGTGFFENPRYEADVRVRDLFVNDEGIGEVSGWVSVSDEILTLEFDAASPRLAVSGTGRIAMVAGADAELSFRFTETSLDPYVRAFEPRLSPFTSAIASGTLRIVGQLAHPRNLLVEAAVEKADLRLFDYTLTNQGPVTFSLDSEVVELEQVRLVGEDTYLDLSGTVDIGEGRIEARATGDANLGILQGFFRDLRSSGRASVSAEISGPLRRPVFSGTATITDGRVRYFSLPHSIEAINGRLVFDSRGVRLTDPVTGAPSVTAQLGRGLVRFGGLIGLDGYVPSEFSLTATGEDMNLRYPEGFRSVIDADLALVGTLRRPTLKGAVSVKSSVYDRRLNIGTGLLELVGLGGGREGHPAGEAPVESSLPLDFDVRIVAPSSLRIENNLAQIVSSADLSLRGSYDRPLLFGRAEVERGRVFFEGKQYVVTYGAVDFVNPTRIEPSFDIRAQTRVRAQGQTYDVDLRLGGTINRLEPQLTSDPPLPPVDILSLLFSDAPQVQDPEIRALQQPNTAQRELLETGVTQVLTSSLSSGVDQLVQQAIGLDAFQITPSFIDPYQRLAPGARLTIGKRISDRVYLTISRSLTSPTDQIIWMLEYDESDRLSWIVSKNEDRTYAVDVRVRQRFR